jgi:hypothetical protein
MVSASAAFAKKGTAAAAVIKVRRLTIVPSLLSRYSLRVRYTASRRSESSEWDD